MNFPIGNSYKATMIFTISLSVIFFVAIGWDEFFREEKKEDELEIDRELLKESTNFQIPPGTLYYHTGTDDDGNKVYYEFRSGEEHNGPLRVLTESEFEARTDKLKEESREKYKKWFEEMSQADMNALVREQNKRRLKVERNLEAAKKKRVICDQKVDQAMELYFKIKNKEVEYIGLACHELSELANEIEHIRYDVLHCNKTFYGMPLECSESDGDAF